LCGAGFCLSRYLSQGAIQTEGIAVKDIMDEVRKSASPYIEMDGECRALAAIMSDDELRAKAIQMLDARMKPYRNKDFPPEITTAWVTKVYLRAKGYPMSARD
jgi:hypothetical protein